MSLRRRCCHYLSQLELHRRHSMALFPKALGTPVSQDQTTRSPSCQSYVSGDVVRKAVWIVKTPMRARCNHCLQVFFMSLTRPGDACEEIRLRKGDKSGCWPSTPTPPAMYKGCTFAMPSVTSAQVQQLPKPRLNANAQEFVPGARGLVAPQGHTPQRSQTISKAPVWEYSSPTQSETPQFRELQLHPQKAAPPVAETQVPVPSSLPMWKESAQSAQSACEQHRLDPAQQLHGLRTDLPSQGSALHSAGHCKPCAWFWKSRGCSNAVFCDYCHLCPPGALKERKKAKIAAIRAGIIEPRSTLKV